MSAEMVTGWILGLCVCFMKMSTLIATCTTGKEHPFLRGRERSQRPVGEWVVVRGVEGGTFGVGWGLTGGHHQK